MAMKLRTSRLLVIGIVLSLFASIALLLPSAEEQLPTAGRRASALQEDGEPKAVIAPLPPEVSNGTLWYLDASASESSTEVLDYHWEVYHKTSNTTIYLYAKKESFLFSKLGLYIITLTVTDNHGLGDTAYTAVYAILDSDMDGLPDWWEMKYFYLLGEDGSGDHDGDGWTNLQEYANGLDPAVKDPRPGIVQDIKDNWYYVAAVAGAIVVAILLMLPVLRRKRKQEEKKKIQAALEIEKALEEE